MFPKTLLTTLVLTGIQLPALSATTCGRSGNTNAKSAPPVSLGNVPSSANGTSGMPAPVEIPGREIPAVGLSPHTPMQFSVSLEPGMKAYTTLHEADQARFEAFRSGSPRNASNAQGSSNGKRAGSIQASNTGVTYTASVGIGNPPSQYTLLIDTGSSNTWVGASKNYTQTNTSTPTRYSMSVSYASGSFTGFEYFDRVTLSSSLVIANQSIGVTTQDNASGFHNVDGILGVGPVDLTYGTVARTSTRQPEPPLFVPTVVDSLAMQKTISSEVLGISYVPITAYPSSTGELTFGGVDSTKYNGSINYVKLTQTYPADKFWGVNQTIKYGSTTLLSNSAGIVDTGTTLTLLASDAFAPYQKLTGAAMDSNTGLLRISTSQYSNLKPLNFVIGGKTYTMSPNAQIWPRALNRAIGGTTNYIYLIIGNLGSRSGQGLDFVNGYTFLERFYTVFDFTNQRFGIATTQYTNATLN